MEASGQCHPSSLCFCFEDQTKQLSPLTRTSLTKFLQQVDHISSEASCEYLAHVLCRKKSTQGFAHPSIALAALHSWKVELNIQHFSSRKGLQSFLVDLNLFSISFRKANRRCQPRQR
jgi:hypothetical protein